MSKLVYDAEYLNNFVKPSLNNATKTVKKAANAAYFTVPSDFRYYNYLTGLDDKLKLYGNKLEGCFEWLEKSLSKIERTLEELNSDAEKLEEPIILEKQKSVITK